MGGVKGFAGIGAAVTLGLALTACGGSSAKPKPAALSAAALKLGLLPASDFGTGVTWDPADTSRIPADSGCFWLVYGGVRGLETASADAGGNVTTDIKTYYERASQYLPGGAAATLSAMAVQGKGACASFTRVLSDGQNTTDTTAVTPESGVGDKADLFVLNVGSPGDAGAALTYHALVADFGDVLISVTCVGSSDFLQSCDLDGKAKKIAQQLKLT